MDRLLYTITFKRIALTNKVTVTDSLDNVVSYSHQKLLKIKEQIKFYANKDDENLIAEVNADSVIDFNVVYTLTDNQSQPLAKLIRKGKSSLWKTDYTITDSSMQAVYKVTEKNPFVKVLDTFLGEIPFLNLLSGYLFHVTYIVSDVSGIAKFEIKKKPALIESRFEVRSTTAEEIDLHYLQIIVVMLMRERSRS